MQRAFTIQFSPLTLARWQFAPLYLFLAAMTLGFSKNLFRGPAGSIVAAIPEMLILSLFAYGVLVHANGGLPRLRDWRFHSVFLLLWGLSYSWVFVTQFELTGSLAEAFITSRYLYMIPVYYCAGRIALCSSPAALGLARGWIRALFKVGIVYLLIEFIGLNFSSSFYEGYYRLFSGAGYRPIFIFGLFFKASGPTFGVQDASIFSTAAIVFFARWNAQTTTRIERVWLFLACIAFVTSFTTTALIGLCFCILLSALVEGTYLYSFRKQLLALAPLGVMALPMVIYLKWNRSGNGHQEMADYYLGIFQRAFGQTLRILVEQPLGIGTLSGTGDNSFINSIGSHDIYFIVALLMGGWLLGLILAGSALSFAWYVRGELRAHPSAVSERLSWSFVAAVIFLSAIHYDTWIQGGFAHLFAFAMAMVVQMGTKDDDEVIRRALA